MGLFSGIKKAFKSVFKGAGKVLGGVFKGLGLAPKMPELPAPPPPTPDNSAEVAAAAEEERRRQRMARGRASTVLTSTSGLLDEPNLARRLLS